MVCEATLWVGSGLLQVIEELRKPGWIVQKQPAHHCLKPCGPCIHSRISSPRTAPGTVATPSDQIELLRVEQTLLFKPGQKVRLSIGTNLCHDSLMQRIGSSWTCPQTMTLVKLPNRITDPSQLQRPQLVGTPTANLGSNPIVQADKLLRAVGTSFTRCKNSSSRTNLMVCATRVLPTS